MDWPFVLLQKYFSTKMVRPPSSSLSEPSRRDSVRASLLNARQTGETHKLQKQILYHRAATKCLEYICSCGKKCFRLNLPITGSSTAVCIFFLAHSVGSALATYKVDMVANVTHPAHVLFQKHVVTTLWIKRQKQSRSLRHTANHMFNIRR